MKKIMILLFITSVWVIAVDYKTPYFRDNYTISTSMRYGWMATSKSATLFIQDGIYGDFYGSKIERYVKLKMRNFYKDLKFTNSDYTNPMNISIRVELDKYNKNPSLYYGFIIFSVVPNEYTRERVSRNYRITTNIIGKEYEIKNLIKKAIDLFIETFAEDTYKIQDIVKVAENKNKKMLDSIKKMKKNKSL